MKKLLVLLAGVTPLLAAAQPKPFTLQLDVAGMPEGTLVYLLYPGIQSFTRDSALVKAGTCHFTGLLNEPVKGATRTEAGGKITAITNFYLEPGALTLKGKDSLQQARIVGSALNDDYYALEKITAPYFKQMLDMRMTAQKMTPEERKSDAVKILNEKYKLVADTFRRLQMAFIKTHPNSFVALETLHTYAGMSVNPAEIGPVFNSLSPALRATATGEKLAKALAKAETTKTGVAAPLFTSYTPAGDTLQLQDIIGQSKLLLVDFWASWCGPCRAENPNVVKAYQQYHDKGFNIISVSLDEKAAPWKAAIAKDNMPWFNASSLKGWNDPAAVLYGVNAIPDNFLVDAKGKIIARGLRGAALDEKLKAILGTVQTGAQKN